VSDEAVTEEAAKRLHLDKQRVTQEVSGIFEGPMVEFQMVDQLRSHQEDLCSRYRSIPPIGKFLLEFSKRILSSTRRRKSTFSSTQKIC